VEPRALWEPERKKARDSHLRAKQTLVEQVFAPAVQQRAVDQHHRSDETTVHAAASRGVATPSSPLPFSNTIQRAFGRHDVSAIQAHTGPAAAASAQAMGADAYAAGDHVVLGAQHRSPHRCARSRARGSAFACVSSDYTPRSWISRR
jgi:hypothetical protein